MRIKLIWYSDVGHTIHVVHVFIKNINSSIST